MTTENIFEHATRSKTRFPYKGACSVEDMWDLNVQELDEIYKSLNTRLRAENESESLLGHRNQATELDLQVAIVRHIVHVKLADAAAAEQEYARAQKKERILSILSDKQDENLMSMSEEELSEMLDEL